jgi:subtilisin family serine protease
MTERRTSARLTSEQPDHDALTTIVARSILEAALAEGEHGELWLELEREGEEEPSRLAVDLTPTDMEQLLALSSEDVIGLSLDGEAIESLFDDPDVEAHRLKGALTIAVAGTALLAPAGHAAVPEVVGAAASTQRASAAVTAQARPATRAAVVDAASRSGVSKALVVRASGFRALRGALVR